MASSKIIPKKSVILGAVPPTGSLIAGEIAINHADKKLYARSPSTGIVQEIGGMYVHSHDELYSVNSTQHLELQNNGSLVLNGATTLTLPSSSGTLATLADITGSVAGVTSVNTRTGEVTLTKSDVGLENCDNTSDANKPISSATQTALDAKAPLDSPTFTGTVGGITKSMVGLGNVDNTSDADKPISTATQTALNAKVGSVTTGIANTTPIANMMQITLAGYNALGVNVAANTLYIIVG